MTVSDGLRDSISRADAFLIGASNGFSITEGLHLFADNAAFRETFGDMRAKYGISCILDGIFFRWPSEEEKWAFYARLIRRWSIGYTGSPATAALKGLVGEKPYFIVTSNVENHFELAGFRRENIFEIEGSWKHMQCAGRCHDTLYPVFPRIPEMAESERGGRIPSRLVPRCPVCGGPMVIHSPQFHAVKEDREAQAALQRFLETYSRKRLVIMELGIGRRNQLIKAPLMEIARNEPLASYVAVNRGEFFIPDEIREKAFGLDADMTEALSALAESVKGESR